MSRVTQSSSGRSSISVTGPVDVDSGFDTGTPAQIDVGTTSIELFAANPDRKYAHIMNNSGLPIYVQYASPAAIGQGIIVRNNTLYTIEFNNLWLGSVNAVGVASSQIIDVFQGE